MHTHTHTHTGRAYLRWEGACCRAHTQVLKSIDTWITPHIHNEDTQHIDSCLRSPSTRAFVQSQRVVRDAALPAQHEFGLQISLVLTTEHWSWGQECKIQSITPSGSDIANYRICKFDRMHFDIID